MIAPDDEGDIDATGDARVEIDNPTIFGGVTQFVASNQQPSFIAFFVAPAKATVNASVAASHDRINLTFAGPSVDKEVALDTLRIQRKLAPMLLQVLENGVLEQLIAELPIEIKATVHLPARMLLSSYHPWSEECGAFKVVYLTAMFESNIVHKDNL